MNLVPRQKDQILPNIFDPEMALYAKRHLIRQGIPEERILKEEKSKTTAENIQYSKKFIKSKESVGIVTNNFHMFRALQIAKRQGLEDPSGIAAESTALYLPVRRIAVKFLKRRRVSPDIVTAKKNPSENYFRRKKTWFVCMTLSLNWKTG